VIYGFVIKEFRVFPFYQLKAIKLSLQPEHDEWYHMRMREFAKVKRGDFELLMIGDSIVEHGAWANFFRGIKVANRGISGDDTQGVLLRMDSIRNTGAYDIIIMLGINDIYDDRHIDDIVKNYQYIIKDLLKMPAAPHVYIMSTLYVSEEDARLTPKIKRLNQSLKHMASLTSQLGYFDLNSVLSQGDRLKAVYTTDGIHLNELGYQRWVCSLYQAGVVRTKPPAFCKEG